MTKSKRYMSLALELAARAGERTYPNPMVGAVIVRNGRVIGRGYHRKAGLDHAEVDAIKDAGGDCKGAAMFVTLEPCDHYGRTPPCTEAIIKSGIKEVCAAMKDPNPLNSGRGVRRLRAAGIKVRTGICEHEARELNRKYIKFITKGLPYVTLKLAQSLDGKIAAADGTSKWISSASSRRFARRIRGTFDAIMVGSGTVTADDPFLLDERRKGYATRRVVADSRLGMSENSNLVKTARLSRVIIATTRMAPAAKIKKFSRIKGVELLLAKSKAGRVDLKDMLSKLAARGIVNILVEGGGELAGSLLDEKLADEAFFFHFTIDNRRG